MVRPKCDKKVEFAPKYEEFKPEGCTKNACTIFLTMEEAEALRLKNIEGLSQTKSSKKMGVSQSTFQRILVSAYKKTSEAIIQGKIIKIINNK